MPDPFNRIRRWQVSVTSVQVAIKKSRRPGKRHEDGGVPVEPDRPNTLSGGASAALEFDD